MDDDIVNGLFTFADVSCLFTFQDVAVEIRGETNGDILVEHCDMSR